MSAETTRETFRRWLSDGRTWIGVFENKDLGHQEVGRRIALSFDDDVWERARIGKDHAPDHQLIGLGWRYILVAKTRDAEEAIRALGGSDGKEDGGEGTHQRGGAA